MAGADSRESHTSTGFSPQRLGPLILDLDGLPFPSRDTLPTVSTGSGMRRILSTAAATRTAPSVIRSPSITFHRPPWRPRSAGNFVEEIVRFRDYGTDYFKFWDDDLWVPSESGLASTRSATSFAVAAQHTFFAHDAGNDVDRDMFRNLRDVGLQFVFVGSDDEPFLSEGPSTRGSPPRRTGGAAHSPGPGPSKSRWLIMFEPYMDLPGVERNLAFFAITCCEVVRRELPSPTDLRHRNLQWHRLAATARARRAARSSRRQRLSPLPVQGSEGWIPLDWVRAELGGSVAHLGTQVENALRDTWRRALEDTPRQAEIERDAPRSRRDCAWFMTGSVDCLKRGRLTLDDRGRLRRSFGSGSPQSRADSRPSRWTRKAMPRIAKLSWTTRGKVGMRITLVSSAYREYTAKPVWRESLGSPISPPPLAVRAMKWI